MLKTKTFLLIPSQNHHQAAYNFDSILTLFCKKTLCDPRQKRAKRPTQLAPSVSGQTFGRRKRVSKTLREVSRLCWNTMLAALATVFFGIVYSPSYCSVCRFIVVIIIIIIIIGQWNLTTLALTELSHKEWPGSKNSKDFGAVNPL